MKLDYDSVYHFLQVNKKLLDTAYPYFRKHYPNHKLNQSLTVLGIPMEADGLQYVADTDQGIIYFVISWKDLND